MTTSPLERTRFSRFYLAGYLLLAGLALLFFPASAMRLLFSTDRYDDGFPRIAGLLLVGLGLMMVGIIRARAAALYPMTRVVRAVFSAGFFGLYLYTPSPLFLAILAVVAFGVLLTGVT